MENSKLYPKMFTWLFVGLLITFATGYALSLNKVLMTNVLSIGILPIIIIEVAIAIFLGVRITKMQPITTKILYILFCIVSGVTFSSIFVTFKVSSIVFIFLITAIIFGILAFYGYITKRDLTKLGIILLVSLLVMIVVIIINALFLRSSSLNIGLTILGVIIFTLYVAYDVNKVKYLMNSIGEEKAAVYGAFQLYLDFINIFVRLLELFGKKK